MALVCLICGYKQHDDETIEAFKERYPNCEEYDIPYDWGACMDSEDCKESQDT